MKKKKKKKKQDKDFVISEGLSIWSKTLKGNTCLTLPVFVGFI